MTSKDTLHNLRHSLAHLLAAAVKELYPDAKPTLGPPVDDGFYYDFDFGETKITTDDLPKIEKKMRELFPQWHEFEREGVSADKARAQFEDNEYKKELIDNLEREGESISLYTSGGFVDLCRGGHVGDVSKDIDPDGFELDRIAGAYWRGDENNTMLTRIYGLAFPSKKELEEYKERRAEATERDHRKIGKELDLFHFSPLVGPGLPLWTPRGTLLRNLLDNLVWKLRQEYGYVMVDIPHITKKELFETSGHWDKFSDELFRITTREGHEFAMKPMNCPFHTQIFARKKHSYREMPQRYANTTKCYRDEQTGELSGISRTRAFTQDDAHVFCRESQVIDEALKIWDIIERFYTATGFGELKIRLSLRDPEHPEKYQGDEELWAHSEQQLREIIEKKAADFSEGIGEAAFYGPKIDFMSYDSLGREWQVATIQADRSMPENFNLSCVNEDGKDERIVMIHAAIMGSIERFLSILLEHTNGVLPVWLSPVQARVLPISDTQNEYAQKVHDELKGAGVRVDLDDSSETLGKKIRSGKLEKIPYLLVVGEKELKGGTITVESRGEGKGESMNVDSFAEIVHTDSPLL